MNRDDYKRVPGVSFVTLSGKRLLYGNCLNFMSGLSRILILFSFLCFLLATHSVFGIVYVDLNAPGPTHDGRSWQTAYLSIQEAINDADSATTDIWVADGTYVEAITLDSGRHLYGGFEGYGGAEESERSQRDWQRNVTTIKGPGNERVVLIKHKSDTRLDGFTITGGNASGSGVSGRGGGIYYENSTGSHIIANCKIVGNSANDGGGLFLYTIYYSSHQIINCTISNNSSSPAGGGVYCLQTPGTFTNCRITNNSSSGWGGGVYCNSANSTFTNSIISNNTALFYGGAFSLYRGSPQIINSTICDNSAGNSGGGIYAGDNSDPFLKNVILVGNNNCAIYEDSSDSDVITQYCLFYDNPDGAFRDYAGATYSDSQVDLLNANVPEAEYNITGDPDFLDRTGGDFHITACSAALDQGTSVSVPSTDKDNNSRPVDLPGIGRDGPGTGYDIGAYELQAGAQITLNTYSLDFAFASGIIPDTYFIYFSIKFTSRVGRCLAD